MRIFAERKSGYTFGNEVDVDPKGLKQCEQYKTRWPIFNFGIMKRVKTSVRIKFKTC